MTTHEPKFPQVQVVEGDLLDQSADAIVNAWNRNIIPWWLLLPQGVSGAIKKRGGVRPFIELGYRPMPLGTARHTGAGRLSFQGIIHVAGINMLWRSSRFSISESVKNACSLAVAEGYSHIAMPIIGAGSGSMSEDKALDIMMETLNNISAYPELRVTVVQFRTG
jgi:O-acetyl-ADP-ribose deacetylase